MRWLKSILIVFCLGLMACSKPKPELHTSTFIEKPTIAVPLAQPSVVISEAVRQEAQALYAQRCTPCHGLTGRGNGPVARGLQPPPPDWSSRAWQASAQDEQLAEVIVKGGQAVGKSLMMPPNLDLADKPALVQALIQIIRGVKN